MKRNLTAYLLIAVLFLSCHAPYTGTVSHAAFYEPGTSDVMNADSEMIRQITPYQEKLNKTMKQVLVHSETSMEKGKPESKLGNFVADACMEIASKKYNTESSTGIDFCILNNGGLRSSLPAGDVTMNNVFELMPFENELVVLTLNGNSVSKILKYIAVAGGVPVSNLRMKIDSTSFSDVLIGGKLFDVNRTYKVVTSDYLLNGGDAMSMLSEKIAVDYLNLKVRDAIIEYMTDRKNKNDSINAVTDGRISQ